MRWGSLRWFCYTFYEFTDLHPPASPRSLPVPRGPGPCARDDARSGNQLSSSWCREARVGRPRFGPLIFLQSCEEEVFSSQLAITRSCPRRRVFLFMLMAVKRNRTACGRRGLGRYPILRLTSSLLRCECARGGAAAGWIEFEKVSECRETAGVGRGARCSFSDRAAGGVSAGRRGEA